VQAQTLPIDVNKAVLKAGRLGGMYGKEKKSSAGIGFFERFLTLWVLLCMAAGC
jgi:hypothetical protein